MLNKDCYNYRQRKIMKYLILLSLLLPLYLQAEVINITPYAGVMKYDTDSNKSLKDNGRFGGLYLSLGTLNYLFEAAYSFTNIVYKNSGIIENLNQHDTYLKYGSYYSNAAYKIGIHAIENSEQEEYRDLGSGYIAIIGADGYNYFSQSKITYGFDAYYSLYPKAHNDVDRNNTTTIDILQVTPHFIYAQTLNDNMSNILNIHANFQVATEYKKSSYISYEIENTFYYHNIYATLDYIGGEMKSGVLNGGMTVYNTKDLLNESYNVKLGYYFTSNFTMDFMFGVHSYKEYDAVNLELLDKGTSMSSVVSMSYSF